MKGKDRMSIGYDEMIHILTEITADEVPEAWDNCGVQINTGKKSIERVLVCLEITAAVLREAKEKGADMIVTHHPLIFRPIKQIDNSDITGSYITELIKNEISVFSAHTNFDKLNGGNNERLSQLLELENVRALGEDAIGCIGELADELSLEEAIRLVRGKIDSPRHSMRAVGDIDMRVKTVGLCTGAGSEFFELAREKGCDIFITGDVSYHRAVAAKEMGLAVIDAGHFGTEQIFAENMASILREKLGDAVEVLASDEERDPFIYL